MPRAWFRIGGRDGDRTLDEQMLAVRPALVECAGKTVLDLGCAEGLIALEFHKAGATVLGLERETPHYEQACRLRREGLDFRQQNLKDVDPQYPLSFDIVLALGIIHKLPAPEVGLRWAVRSAKSLLLLRSGRGESDGIIYGKFTRAQAHIASVMESEGMTLEKTVDGPKGRGEPVTYWRRK